MKAGWPGIRFVVASRGAFLRGPLNRDAWGDGADVVDIVQRQWRGGSSLAAFVETGVVVSIEPIHLTRSNLLTQRHWNSYLMRK